MTHHIDSIMWLVGWWVGEWVGEAREDEAKARDEYEATCEHMLDFVQDRFPEFASYRDLRKEAKEASGEPDTKRSRNQGKDKKPGESASSGGLPDESLEIDNPSPKPRLFEKTSPSEIERMSAEMAQSRLANERAARALAEQPSNASTEKETESEADE